MWMIVPLVMTVYFSFLRYNLLSPGATPWAGWDNYYWFFTDPSFKDAIWNTLALVGGILLITVIGGIGLALLLDKPMFGTGIIRIMVIAPFFVMPTVSALVWKNMFFNPVNGIFGNIATSLGFQPIDFFAEIVSYPFRYDSYNRVVRVDLPPVKTAVPGTRPRGFEAFRARAQEALHRR